MRRLVVAVLAVCAAACRPQSKPAGPTWRQVKEQLAHRDQRLTSYQLVGTTTDSGGIEARFSFAYREPNRMRATLFAPVSRELSFNGHILKRVIPEERRVEVYSPPSAPERAELLGRAFQPFVPEGFRVPLFSPGEHRVEWVKRDGGEQAVRIREDHLPEGGTGSVLLRWPSADFLERRMDFGTDAVTRMLEEQCEPNLGLCVPTRVIAEASHKVQWTAVMTKVELNAPLRDDAFEVDVPDGYAAKQVMAP